MSPPDDAPPPEENLQHWIDAAQQGSADALGQVLQYCRQYLLAVANDKLDTDLRAKAGASDLVQDTILEAQRDFARFRGQSEGELLAWLRQILLHNLANLGRQYRDTDKRQVQREVALGEAPAKELLGALVNDHSTPSARAQRRERDEALLRALEQLPEHYRQVILWRNYELCSFEEIGRKLQRSAGAARRLWGRAGTIGRRICHRQDNPLGLASSRRRGLEQAA